MQQEPLNLVEFQRKFSTEEACWNTYLSFDGQRVIIVPDVVTVHTAFTALAGCTSVVNASIRSR